MSKANGNADVNVLVRGVSGTTSQERFAAIRSARASLVRRSTVGKTKANIQMMYVICSFLTTNCQCKKDGEKRQ